MKSTNTLAQVWSVHHSGHTYLTRLCVAHLQSKLSWGSCIFPAALLRWQHAPGCAVVTAPPDLSIFQEPKWILVQMTPTQEGPGALIRPPTPEEQPPPWVLLVLCPSKELSGLSCWRFRAPNLKGNISSAHNSLTSRSSCLVTRLWFTLCDPMDCRPPDSSVHGILQARILEWVSILFSRGSSRPRDQSCISCIGRWALCQESYLWSPLSCILWRFSLKNTLMNYLY